MTRRDETRKQMRLCAGERIENDWVADLACGHGQHVRHNPPWQNRPWVITEQGRKEKLGVMLECKKCEEETE